MYDGPGDLGPDDSIPRAVFQSSGCSQDRSFCIQQQPWRMIRSAGNKFHYYMKEDAAYNTAFKNNRIQNLDMGIAMCHFELAAVELGLNGVWEIMEPMLESGDLKYIVTWVG